MRLARSTTALAVVLLIVAGAAVAGLANGHPTVPVATTPPAPSATTTPTTAAECGSTIQGQIDATPAGGNLELGGCSYSVARPARVTRAITIHGGSLSGTTGGLLITASNVTVSGMTIIGPGQQQADGSFAIEIRGGSANAFLSNVVLDHNTLRGWGGEGIHAGFVDGFTFSKNVISDIWYAGIGCYSMEHGTIAGNHVSTVVGTENAYGIYLSRSYGGGLAVNPRSSDIEVSGNTIEDIPHWEGLDTHAGQRIRFVDNVVRRVYNAIQVGGSRDATGGPVLYAPIDITVQGNTLDSGVTDGSLSAGIVYQGANAGNAVLGSSTELATGGLISNNTITGYGIQDNGDSGSIELRDTSGIQVTGNTIIDPSPSGIEPYFNNYDFTISGNTIQGPWSNTLGYAYGIYVHVDYNTGTISGNTFSHGTKSARSVLTEAVAISNYTHNQVAVH